MGFSRIALPFALAVVVSDIVDELATTVTMQRIREWAVFRRVSEGMGACVVGV